jgi:hypothetical protein
VSKPSGDYIHFKGRHTLYAVRDAADFAAMDKMDLKYWFEHKNNNAPLDDLGAMRFVSERLGEEDQ